MTPAEFLPKAFADAIAAGHIWPEFAACEAALESAWGESKLARLANNLFGQKSGFTSTKFPVISIPTHEVEDGKIVLVKQVEWPQFPDWKTSFAERMELLKRSPLYRDAIAATDGERFIQLVSKHWSTDPERGDKVLAIHRRHFTHEAHA